MREGLVSREVLRNEATVRRMKEDAPPAPFSVRRMTPEDLPEILEIERKAFRNPWSDDLLKRELTHDWSTILLAEERLAHGTRLLGFLIFWLVHDELHILNVATHPSHR